MKMLGSAMPTKTAYRTMKDVPREEYLAPGSPLCAGCGGLILLKHALKALGPNTIIVNVPGCLALLTLYPFASTRTSLVFAPFACAPAVAQGIRDALDILIRKGRHSPDRDFKVLVFTGDGAAYDIGLQSTSGAIHRQLDFYYLCYDNEAYGNTGFQFSSATPFGSTTTTTVATAASIGNVLSKKDLFEIWRGHRPPYLATVCASRPVDLWRKFERASKIKGPKLFIGLSVCPTGWMSDPAETVRIDKLAVETGIWPLKEAINGVVRHTFIPKQLKPVEEYLITQKRFAHLFYPEKRKDIINFIQEQVNSYWGRVWSEEGTRP